MRRDVRIQKYMKRGRRPGVEGTGVDLSKILGGQRNWGQKVVKSDKCMSISQLLGGTWPGCPQKSTPMVEGFAFRIMVVMTMPLLRMMMVVAYPDVT